MTAAQEAILEQIIEAFQNGKRLSDLPDVSGTNPFNLICEVLEDGESKKAALATLLPYMEEECRDRKSTRLNSSHRSQSRMPSSA